VLKEAGYRVDRVVDVVSADLKDPEVLALADSLGAILITQDDDFRLRKRFSSRQHRGIVLLRDTHIAADAVLRRLLRLLQRTTPQKLEGTLVVIDRRSCRIRR